MDPIRVASALPALGEAVVTNTGLDAEMIDGCISDYEAELETASEEIAADVSVLDVDQRKLVTNHDAFGYFADRYNFEIIGTVIPGGSTLAESNAAQLQELSETIESAGVAAIFAEEQESTQDADAVAATVDGVEVITLLAGTLGESGSGSDTLIGMLENNAELIAAGLAGE